MTRGEDLKFKNDKKIEKGSKSKISRIRSDSLQKSLFLNQRQDKLYSGAQTFAPFIQFIYYVNTTVYL